MLFGTIALAGAWPGCRWGKGWRCQPTCSWPWPTEGARLFANMPYAAVQLPPFPLWLLFASDAIVVGGWRWNQWMGEGHNRPHTHYTRPSNSLGDTTTSNKAGQVIGHADIA